MGLRQDFGTYNQYSHPTCSKPEAACGIICSRIVRQTVPGNATKFGDHRSNHSQVKQLANSMMDDKQMPNTDDGISRNVVWNSA